MYLKNCWRHWGFKNIQYGGSFTLEPLVTCQLLIWRQTLVSEKTYYIIITSVLKMKIWIYWSESNPWIYFYIVLYKNWKFTDPNKVLLVMGRRTRSPHDDCYIATQIFWLDCEYGHEMTSYLLYGLIFFIHSSSLQNWEFDSILNIIIHSYWLTIIVYDSSKYLL